MRIDGARWRYVLRFGGTSGNVSGPSSKGGRVMGMFIMPRLGTLKSIAGISKEVNARKRIAVEYVDVE